MKLPIEFIDRMKNMLGDAEYDEFIKSYDRARFYGLRLNTLKISVEKFLALTDYKLESIPWTKDGFYYDESIGPGKHPYYHAGLYYIQEPSAMLPGAMLDAQPGDKVLDLCAAPGGKTVQIAAAMKGKGLLIANDISSDRVKVLIKNIELYGIRNAIVTNETPERLATNFKGYFDRIIVDAPCSGEGMFRKDEDATKSWEKFNNAKCAGMQKDILRSVDTMLKPGGIIVYSTCTFSTEENEMIISQFLQNHKDYELVEIPKLSGIQEGRSDWADGRNELKYTARLWPHKLKGEGHFVAKLRKKALELIDISKAYVRIEHEELKNDKLSSENSVLQAFRSFETENLNTQLDGFFLVKGNNLYNLPQEPSDFSGIKISKYGWYLGSEASKNKFEPSHSMLTALCINDIKRTLDFDPESREITSYLKGETLILEGEIGYTGICVSGFTIGWAKQMDGIVKNLYPKGWRKMN